MHICILKQFPPLTVLYCTVSTLYMQCTVSSILSIVQMTAMPENLIDDANAQLNATKKLFIPLFDLTSHRALHQRHLLTVCIKFKFYIYFHNEQGSQSCMCDTEHMFSCPDSAMNMFNKQQVSLQPDFYSTQQHRETK